MRIIWTAASMATSKDVAALAGVSQSTVSYVMTGKRTISEETKKKVHAAMAQLQFQPNAGARALASRRTSIIGLVVKFVATTDMAGVLPFIETITASARENDYDVVLITTDEGSAGLQRLASRALVDAVILMDIRANDDRMAVAADLGIPVILIGVPLDAHGLDAIDIDFVAAGALAVRELALTGHRNVIVIGEPPEVADEHYRFIEGFDEGATAEGRERGLSVRVERPSRPGWPGIEEIGPLLLAARDDALGIVARTPQAVSWVLQLLLLEGLVPGKDVSVVALCTDAMAESFWIPVTNVSPEPRRISRLAMQTAFARLDNDSSPGRTQLVEPRLTRRGTTVDHSDV